MYPTDFLAEFDEESKKCYTIAIKSACIFEQACQDSAKYALPVNTKFIDKFNSDLATALSDFKQNFQAQSVFDSMSVEIVRDDAAYAEQVIENTDHVKNFECFNNAVVQSPGAYANLCDKYESIVYFQLSDYTAQDLNVLPTQELEIEKVDRATANSTMKVSRKVTNVRSQQVGREDLQYYPLIDFETLWQVSFALESRVTHARQIWFIQDDQEGRKGSKRLLAAKER